MRAPSGENAALCTASSCPRRAAISAPVAASQMRAVPSKEAVTMRAPSGENAALRTQSSCPRRTAISAPVAASQSGAVRSAEAVTMRAPSGENAAARTATLVPAQGGDLGAGGGVPDARRAVVGGGDDAGAVGRERSALHRPLVPAQGGDLGAGGGVPDARRAVVGGGDDAGAVGRERGALHPILVPAQAQPFGAGRRQSRPAGPGPAIAVEPRRTCAGQARVAEPSEQLAGEFAPVLHQRWQGKPDRPPDPPHVGVGAFGEIAAVKRTSIGRVQPRLDPCVVRQQGVGRSILVGAPQMPDQKPPAIGLIERKRVPHPRRIWRLGPNHCGMCCLQPIGAKFVAQIPQHVVVQP